MKWRVATTPNGAYKIIPKTGASSNYVLATSTSFGTNNANLIQGDYLDNNSYRDEWYILDTTKKYSQVSLGFSDASSLNSNVKTYYEANAHAYGTTYTSINKSMFIDELTNSTYFGGVLHGDDSSNALQLSPSVILELSEISALSESDFDDVKVVFLSSCYSGRRGGFVDTLLDKGVDVVIGFVDEIEQDTTIYWTDRFVDALTQGNTVQYSIDYANAELEDQFENCGEEYDMFRAWLYWGLYSGTSDLNSAPCS